MFTRCFIDQNYALFRNSNQVLATFARNGCTNEVVELDHSVLPGVQACDVYRVAIDVNPDYFVSPRIVDRRLSQHRFSIQEQFHYRIIHY